MKSELPIGVERFLRLGVPIDQVESICGDLEEEYVDLRRRNGRLRATAAAWRQAAGLALGFARERAIHGRGLPPIADEVARRSSFVESFAQDAGFALRMMKRQPAFAATAIFALALGSGVTIAVVSVVDSALWRPLPYAGDEALVAIGEQRPREQRAFGPVSAADFLDWRRDNGSFTSMAAYMSVPMNLTGIGEPERIAVLSASPGFLNTLNVPSARGRDFAPEEEQRGRERVAMLTDGFWRTHFGADPAVVGRTIRLNDLPYEVVGILPPSFWWSSQPQLLVPLEPMAFAQDEVAARSLHFLQVIARRNPAVTFEQAGSDLDAIGRRLEQQFPNLNNGHLPRTTPFRETLVGDVRPAFLLFLAGVGLVLTMACTSVALLLLARSSVRRKELAVRAALGAGRTRLVRQLLTESLLLGLIGAAAGVLGAMWILAAARGLLPARYAALPGIDSIAIDARVAGVALGLSFLTSLFFGSVSAFTAPVAAVVGALKEEGRTAGPSTRGHAIRAALVTAEVALSLILLVGASLLIVSFKQVLEVSPGFTPERLVTAQISLPATKYANRMAMVAFHEELAERLRALPGVVSAGAVTALPFTGVASGASFQIEGRPPSEAGPRRVVFRLVTPQYLQTIQMPLVRGRLIDARDRDPAPPVILLNGAAARRYFPSEDPLGRRVSFSPAGGTEAIWMEVVGIVGDIKQASLETEAQLEVYLPYPQVRVFNTLGANMMLAVRTSPDAPPIAASL